MLLFTFLFSASLAAAQLSESNLKTYVGSFSLSADFNPIKEAYWTGLPHHRRTPFAVSPDGKSAYVAYLDASDTDVHIQQVDPSSFTAVGDAVTVTGAKEAGGLVAHNDGFALLTNEAMPSGTTNAPPASTPVAVLYRYTSGKQTWKTWLGGPDNAGSMGALASPDLNGDLAYSEASGMYGAYFVVTAYSGSAQGHFGDAIQYVSAAGKLTQVSGASSSWGCSHNTGIALEAADEAPFASLCSEDQGAIWLNTGGTGMSKSGVKVSNENVQNGAGNEAMGGTSGSYSSLARFVGSGSYIFSWVSRGAKDLTENEWMGSGYTHSVNRTVNRDVAIATFSDKKTMVGEQATSALGPDGDKQVNWITTGSADCQNAHVAALDGSNALVSWEEIAEPTCEFIAMGCKGAFTGSYFQLVKDGKKVGTPVKSMDVFVAGDMVTMSDGRVCWPYVSMDWKLDGPVRNAASVKSMSFACVSLEGTGSDVPASPSASATPAPSEVPAAAPSPVFSSSLIAQASSVAENADASGSPIEIGSSAATTTPSAAAPADSSLPSFAIVTSGATIEPPSTPTPVVTPTPARSSTNGAGSASSKPFTPVPASESFNPSLAPAFTQSDDVPNISSGPVYTSTPCAGQVTPTITETSRITVTEYASDVASLPLSGVTPTPQVPAGGALDDFTPYASGTGSSIHYSPYPTGSGYRSPPMPTGTGQFGHGSPSGRPSFVWGRPRPSGWGAWPGRGNARPTRGFGRGPRPSVGFDPERYGFEKGEGAAKTTPCTLETRVRPTPTEYRA